MSAEVRRLRADCGAAGQTAPGTGAPSAEICGDSLPTGPSDSCACAPCVVREVGSAVCEPAPAPWPWVQGEQADAPDTCAIVVAGGSGERFGDPRGKQFVPLCGLPILAWSVLALDRVASVGQIVVVCPAERMSEVRDAVLGGLSLRCPVTIVAGGETRQDSVYAGLVAAPSSYAYLAIHDGARPLVEAEAVERCIAAVRADESLAGAILAARETDTLKVAGEDGVISATPDRSRYWCAQTPQVFRAPAIREAHRAAAWDDFAGTDDASLVEHRGGRVRVVESPRDNIKITVPEDLAIAEATLRARLERGI